MVSSSDHHFYYHVQQNHKLTQSLSQRYDHFLACRFLCNSTYNAWDTVHKHLHFHRIQSAINNMLSVSCRGLLLSLLGEVVETAK